MAAMTVLISTLRDMPASHRPMSRDRWLVEQKLGMTVPAWVQPHRDKHRTWDAIAEEMTTELGLPDHVPPISRQILQKWCADTARAEKQ
jgi:hypothetical protein